LPLSQTDECTWSSQSDGADISISSKHGGRRWKTYYRHVNKLSSTTLFPQTPYPTPTPFHLKEECATFEPPIPYPPLHPFLHSFSFSSTTHLLLRLNSHLFFRLKIVLLYIQTPPPPPFFSSIYQFHVVSTTHLHFRGWKLCYIRRAQSGSGAIGPRR
jgi:hypothetical protein